MMAAAISSMTGFGRAAGALSPRFEAEVRITSVNARFLEPSLRVHPRFETGELELGVRSVLAERLQRGRVQVVVDLQAVPGAAPDLAFRWRVAEALLAELGKRPAELELAPLSLRDLLAVPGFAEGGELRLSDDEHSALLALIAVARDALIETRCREAAELRGQIDGEIALVGDFRDWLAGANTRVREVLLARLHDRLAEALSGAGIPDDRLLQEAALAADRADIAEEVERLGAHLTQAQRILAVGGAVGKKLDFLLQEMLREVNTAGSKCREAGLGVRVVDAKSALEKLREQIANLE